MLLTVIVPDKQPGMEWMLKKELAGVDAEVIKKSWTWGLKKAKGDYVCLLEKDSAVSLGTIRRNLEVFTNNQAYRKLAMVSPRVDLPNMAYPLSWSCVKGHKKSLAAYRNPVSTELHSVRIGQVHGAVIRRTSLIKSGVPLNLHPYDLTTALSLFFWENGLRIALEPKSLYYAPENASYAKNRYPKKYLTPKERTIFIWEREMIS